MENLKIKFVEEKIGEFYQNVYTKQNPLVTVTMTTFNRCQTLLNYSLKSVLEQTYKNLEIIVVGDRCTDDTEKEMAKITDSRVHFINLIDRPEYAIDEYSNWVSAGVYPFNLGLGKSTGDFLTHLDDDDSFVPERIEKLVKFIQEGKYDAVHHPFTLPPQTVNSVSWTIGQVTTSALFFHGWFKNILGNPLCYELNEPGDWNRCRSILELGVSIGRYPELLTYKMKSRR